MQNSNTDSNSTKEVQVQRIILLEGAANFVVLLAKVVVGITTGSLAIIGDALHSLTDVANNIVAWAIVKHAAKPADKEHPYGHQKFETLAVLGLAVILVVLAFELALHAIQREPSEIGASNWELAVMLSVLVINIGLASWQRMWANRLDSKILKADASHTFSDVLTTLAVIAGWQLSAYGYVWLDQLTAIGVSGIILYLAYELFKSAAPVLLDEYSIDPELLTDLVEDIDGVSSVERVRSRWIGDAPSVDMIIRVPHHLSTHESHQICDQIEQIVESKFEVTDVSIHVEPFLGKGWH